MARFNLKSFAHPDLLKRITPVVLLQILEPQHKFFEDRGFVFPSTGSEDLDYRCLAGILARPDENMDGDLVEAFHLVGAIGTDENFDRMLEIAEKNRIDTGDGKSTAPDLAARIWLSDPQILARLERTDMCERRKKFESFRARIPEQVVPAESLPLDLSPLEQDLDRVFELKKRGIGTYITRKDGFGESVFFVQHGQPCKREPSRRGRQSTAIFYRPEKTDIVIYDFVGNELKINASSLTDIRIYRTLFGKHVFGDEQKFVYSEKYTLQPLVDYGEEALNCRDIAGMEWVRLVEIEYEWGTSLEYRERHTAKDVFAALAARQRGLEWGAVIRTAKFQVKLSDERRPHSISIRPKNIASYGRGERALILEEWLRAREFILVGTAVENAEAGTTLASA